MEPLLNRRGASLFLGIDTPHYLIGFISYSLTLIPKSQNGESGLTYGFVDRLQNTQKIKMQQFLPTIPQVLLLLRLIKRYGFFDKLAKIVNLIRKLAILSRTPQRSGFILHLLPRPPSPRGIVRIENSNTLNEIQKKGSKTNFYNAPIRCIANTPNIRL